MEISGIEGNFRITCENTMRVLRQNKDSLMAIFEAFVYDPLVSFKLLAQNLKIGNQENSGFQSDEEEKLIKEISKGKELPSKEDVRKEKVQQKFQRDKRNSILPQLDDKMNIRQNLLKLDSIKPVDE